MAQTPIWPGSSFFASGLYKTSKIDYKDPSPWVCIIEHRAADRGNKLMWLENPRSGTSTMKHFLGRQPNNFGKYKDKSRFKITELRMESLPEKQVRIIPRIIRFSKNFKFGICRDPYHRIVSCYRMIKELPTKGGIGKGEIKNLTFESFVDKVVEEEWENHHWAPQHWFLPTEKINFDIIFKLETLSDNFGIIFDKLNVKDKELEVVRPISKKVEYDVDSYLTDKETVEKIRNYYYKDFELYEMAQG